MKFSFAFTLMLVVSAPFALANELRIGTSADFPPWESVSPDGVIVGFDRDFGDELCKRIKADCTWENQTFDGLLPSLQVGKFDLIISGMSVTEERSEMVDFTVAYADAPRSLVVRKGSELAEFTDLASIIEHLKGKSVGVQIGSTQEAAAKENFSGATVRTYDRPNQIADDLTAERIDVGMMEHSAWEPLVSDREDLEFVGPLISSSDFAEFGKGTGIALKKGRTPLREKLNSAIANMLADGTLTELSNLHFGYDISAK